jgi:hypothetical protein
MPWNDEDTRTHIKEIQYLQQKIVVLEKAHEATGEPSLEETIAILRNSQDKLYNSLASRGINAEDAYRIIMENDDRELVQSVIKLQKSIASIEKQLADPDISPQKRQSLENSQAQKSQQHKAKWDEIKSSPNKNDLMTKIEQIQEKEVTKSREQDKTHEAERTR